MTDQLTPALSDPQSLRSLSENDWDELIRQSRPARLLGMLEWLVEQHNLWDVVPEHIRWHLESGRVVCSKHQRMMRFELSEIQRVMSTESYPMVLIKGVAYVALELPPARRRLYADVDLLVDQTHLKRAEMRFKIHGWRSKPMDEYDDYYYRQWMHEIPPLTNIRRHTVLDLHHNILPLTSASKVDVSKLLEDIRPVPSMDGLYTLAPVDMVIHSAAHLLFDGEFDHGLRDILDLDLLMRHYTEHEPDFWGRLVDRAQSMGLARPMYYALSLCSERLQTPIPDSAIQTLKQAAGVGLIGRWTLGLLLKGIRPEHETAEDAGGKRARFLLYIRGHWLRMPPWLLIPHLSRKAMMRLKSKETPDDDQKK